MSKPKLDITFEGGGARGLALNGAMAELEKEGFLPGRLVGTSAGAICATLLAAGYTGAQLEAVSSERTPAGLSTMTVLVGKPKTFSDSDLLSSSLGTFLQSVPFPTIPFLGQRIELWVLRALLRLPLYANIFSFVEQGGLFSADGFITWFSEKLEARGAGMSKLTLAEMFQRTGRHLTVVATDTTRGTFCVLNHITAPKCPVVWAVRMSMGIPFFWPEVVWPAEWGAYGVGQSAIPMTGHTMVDGGVVSNFALRLLVSGEEWIHQLMGGPPDPEAQVLGLCLDTQAEVPHAPPHVDLAQSLGAAVAHSKIFNRIDRVLDAASSGNDLAEAFSHPDMVCFLPAKGYSVTEFNMSLDRINALLLAGRKAMRTWLTAREQQMVKIKDVPASKI